MHKANRRAERHFAAFKQLFKLRVDTANKQFTS